MPNGTIFIDVGEDPDAFVMHDNNLDMRMPHEHIQNLKMENVVPPGQPAELWVHSATSSLNRPFPEGLGYLQTGKNNSGRNKIKKTEH